MSKPRTRVLPVGDELTRMTSEELVAAVARRLAAHGLSGGVSVVNAADAMEPVWTVVIESDDDLEPALANWRIESAREQRLAAARAALVELDSGRDTPERRAIRALAAAAGILS